MTIAEVWKTINEIVGYEIRPPYVVGEGGLSTDSVRIEFWISLLYNIEVIDEIYEKCGIVPELLYKTSPSIGTATLTFSALYTVNCSVILKDKP